MNLVLSDKHGVLLKIIELVIHPAERLVCGNKTILAVII